MFLLCYNCKYNYIFCFNWNKIVVDKKRRKRQSKVNEPRVTNEEAPKILQKENLKFDLDLDFYIENPHLALSIQFSYVRVTGSSY